MFFRKKKNVQSLNIANLAIPGLICGRFEDLVHNAESITQNIYAWQIIPHNKIAPN